MSARMVLVTGASAGIGFALAQRALAAGLDVFGVGRSAEGFERLSAASHDSAGTLATLRDDLLAPGAPARIVAAALARFGRIDVLVNNAGAVAVGPIGEQSDAALREQLLLHVAVPLALVREALPALRVAQGHVFFLGSGVARVPVPGLGAYPSAKAAVRNAARIARSELRRDGIAVTYVDPGAVDTGFMRRAGLAGAPRNVAVAPELVAEKLLRAIDRRPTTVNAAPWQTAALGLAELFPALTDAALRRFPSLVGASPAVQLGSAEPNVIQAQLPKLPAPEPAYHASARPEPAPEEASAFDAALAPLARRMERLNLSRKAVSALLVEGATLETGDAALRWAGMPNKHERALMHDVLEALADAGYLERSGPEQYACYPGRRER